MLRTTTCGLAALLLLAGSALADPISAKVKKVDDNKLVVTVDDKDVTYDVAKDVKVTRTAKAKKGAEAKTEDLKDGLSGLKEGAEVKLTVEKKDGKDTVTKIDMAAKAKKKKKNKAE